MLGRILKQCWRKLTAGSGEVESGEPRTSATGIDDAMAAAVRRAIGELIREPLAYPPNIDFEMVARLKAASENSGTICSRVK